MPAIFFALISNLGWAIGDIFGTLATRRIGGYAVTFWMLFFTSLLFGLYIPFALPELSAITLSLLFLIGVLAFIWLIGVIAYFEGLRVGNASLVGTIGASFSALVVILSIIFLKEEISPAQTAAILVIFLGIVLSTLNPRELAKSNVRLDKGVMLAIIAMVCWGIYFTFIKIPVREIGWFWPMYLTFLIFPLVLPLGRLRNIKITKPSLPNGLLLLVAAFLTGAGNFSFNLGIDIGLTAIVAPIAGSYSALFVVLAFIFFKDPISKQQVIGIITTLIGIVLLSFFSV